MSKPDSATAYDNSLCTQGTEMTNIGPFEASCSGATNAGVKLTGLSDIYMNHLVILSTDPCYTLFEVTATVTPLVINYTPGNSY